MGDFRFIAGGSVIEVGTYSDDNPMEFLNDNYTIISTKVPKDKEHTFYTYANTDITNDPFWSVSVRYFNNQIQFDSQYVVGYPEPNWRRYIILGSGTYKYDDISGFFFCVNKSFTKMRMYGVWSNGSIFRASTNDVAIYDPATTPPSSLGFFPPWVKDTIFGLYGDGFDPNSAGGNSGQGGGTGTFDGTGDSIDFQDLPTLSAVDAGFITLYSPTRTQLNALAQYMWTTDFIDNIKKLFGNPMDAILGLSIVPALPPLSGEREVAVGFISTGVNMSVLSSQYVKVDCGSLSIKEYWGSALDYSPYTKIQLYLPYVGVREINTDDVMNKTIHVVYNIDVLSGSLTAQVKCGNSVLYQFSGTCSSSIPVTGRDLTQIITSGLNIAAATGAFVATAGISAPVSASMALSGIMTTANNVMNAKPRIEHSGSMGGTNGLMGIQTPYLIVERPRQSLPKDYNTFQGYPSNITKKLSELSGYTEVESIHLENISCTTQELDEIERLLKGGVIF